MSKFLRALVPALLVATITLFDTPARADVIIFDTGDHMIVAADSTTTQSVVVLEYEEELLVGELWAEFRAWLEGFCVGQGPMDNI